MIVGLLLAAGGARRFGSQKLVARVGGVPIVRLAATTLASVVDQLIVVVGHDASSVRGALSGVAGAIVENHAWADGQSTSLRAGIRALPPETDAVVVTLGDQPHVDPGVIERLIDTWRRARAAIVAPRYRGVRGNPVVFDRSVFEELEAVEGDAGARDIIARSPERVAIVEVDAEMPRDVDTPSDLGELGAE